VLHVNVGVDQDYAEVEPIFVKKFFHDLDDYWYVLDESGESFALKFNKSCFNPILIQGWSDLGKFDGFPANVEVVFGYYGYSLFRAEIFRGIMDGDSIPKFQSRSAMPNETIYFDTHVWENDLKNAFFVR